MMTRLQKMIVLSAVFFGLAAFGADESVAKGTFVQKKILKDVDVTLTSTGIWTFEKDKAFTWQTLKPVPSFFTATPTNYTFSAGGRTTSQRLAMKIDDLAQIFEIKEMKAFVEKVETDTEHPVAVFGDVVIPSALRVFFRNGDRLEIALAMDKDVPVSR